MSDITLNSVASGYNLGKINQNFTEIETKVNDELLHTTGGNNIMTQNLDMNSQRILNLPPPASDYEPARLIDLDVSGQVDGLLAVKEELLSITTNVLQYTFPSIRQLAGSAFFMRDTNGDLGTRLIEGYDYVIREDIDLYTLDLTRSWSTGNVLQRVYNSFVGGDNNASVTSGLGDPEGVVSALVGTIYSRTDGLPNETLYTKESGTGSTGWVAQGGASRGFVHNTPTLSEAIAATDIAVGDSINLAERTAGNGGGAMWDVVLASGVTANTFDIVACTGIPTLALQLRRNADGTQTIKQVGANESGDNVGALKAAIALGGKITLGKSGTFNINAEVRLPLNGSTSITSSGAIIKYNGPQVADDVVTLIHLTGNGTEFVNTDLIMDGGMVSQNNFIPVCLTVNGADVWRENSKLRNAATGANPVNVKLYISDTGVLYRNMRQTTAASAFGGTYGYGFVSVNVGRGIVMGGTFGTPEEPIDRHAVYISTNNDGSGNCGPFTITGSIINQLEYADNVLTPVTEFEYCIKSISSSEVTVTGVTSNGGVGFILLTTRVGSVSGTCTYDNNIVRTGQRCVAVFAENNDETNSTRWARVSGGSGNVIVLASPFASAMRLQMITNVTDYSTYIIENTVSKNSAYECSNVTAANPIATLSIFSTIYDFLRVFSGGNVNNLNVDVNYANPDTVQYPLTYSNAVANKNIKINFLTSAVKYYRLAGNAGLDGIKYYEEDFGREITNTVSLTPIWVDDNGDNVAGQLANRPLYVSKLHKFWEQDQSRFVYWTGSTWWTSKTSYPEFADTATIQAVNVNILGHGAHIYNTTTAKPYWYDDAASLWKDAAGVSL